MKVNIKYTTDGSVDDCETVNDIVIYSVEIVTDEAQPEQVEIYMLDENNQRVEGGTFPLQHFLDYIVEYYRNNY